MERELWRGLRAEVREHAGRGTDARTQQAQCLVGVPGRVRVLLPYAAPPSHGAGSLATDLVHRALEGVAHPEGCCVWLRRPGELGRGDAETWWYAGALAGFARHGLVLPAFVVLNRTGWLDLVGGERHSWSRVRPAAAPDLPRRPWDLFDPLERRGP